MTSASDSRAPSAPAPRSSIVRRLRDMPLVVDWAPGILLFVFGTGGMFAFADRQAAFHTAPNAFAVLLIAGMSLPLAWRRRHPRTVLAIAIASLILFLVLDFPDNGASIGAVVAMYAVGAHCPRRQSFPAFLVTAAVMLPVMIAGTIVDYVALPWISVIGNYAIYFTAWVLGDSLRTRRAYLRELEHRAESAERARDEQARRAVEAERDRIARELHDVVAHSMAVMVVQAGAARRVLHSKPEQADEALRQVEATGRAGMVEMRRLVGVLRDDEDEVVDRAPQPGLDGLPALVEQWEQAGLPIELEISGEPRPLPVGVDLSAYRIVQEALTNTFKHAGTAHAKVQVSYGEDDLEVQITDDGRGLLSETVRANGRANRDAEAGSDGHGLLGMRERVTLIGGDLRVGPRSGGGFEVTARLPVGAPSAP